MPTAPPSDNMTDYSYSFMDSYSDPEDAGFNYSEHISKPGRTLMLISSVCFSNCVNLFFFHQCRCLTYNLRALPVRLSPLENIYYFPGHRDALLCGNSSDAG